MLHELAEYARKHHLSGMPGFKSKNAKWIIALSEEGKYIDILEDERNYEMCPHLEQPELIAGGITRSHFLLDTISVVMDMDPNEKTREKTREKYRFFINLLDQAAEHEPLLKCCANLLKDEESMRAINSRIIALKCKLTENITFRVGNVYIVELSSWHTWWQKFRRSLQTDKKDAQSMVCFLSGEVVKPIASHPKISGLTSVGGQASGTVLAGFDKASFTSYNLSQSFNAACSEESAILYRNALNSLIQKAPRPLAGMMFLHWYKEPILEEDDLLLFDDYENREMDEISSKLKVERIFNAIKDGNRPEFLMNTFYILQLSATGGRIMVRDWISGDFYDLVTKMRKWFDDISIVSPNGNSVSGDFKLSAALMRMVSYRPKERIGDTFNRIDKELSPIMPRLWRSILDGTPLVRVLAERCLTYIRSKLLNADEENARNDANLDRIACALLKAWLIREEESKGGIISMKLILNEEHPSPAYHAGRMMAVLASLQQSALGDVGSGVIQRYYAAASTTPALVLGRLVRMAQYHLEKIDKGLAIWYEKQLSAITSQMGDSIPTTLTLEEQALFALGYYQQKAHMMTSKSE